MGGFDFRSFTQLLDWLYVWSINNLEYRVFNKLDRKFSKNFHEDLNVGIIVDYLGDEEL